jgi:plastocyanin
MKHIIFTIIVLLLIGCTTVVEETSKPKQEPVEEIIQKETKPQIQKPVDIPENNVIKIGTDKFEPDYAFFNDSKTIIWENEDTRQHLIACYYYGGGRVFIGDKLDNQGKTEHTFKEHGTYICVDAIYGYRGTVVIYKKPLEHLSPATGAVVSLANTKDPPIAWPATLLVALLALLTYFSILRR